MVLSLSIEKVSFAHKFMRLPLYFTPLRKTSWIVPSPRDGTAINQNWNKPRDWHCKFRSAICRAFLGKVFLIERSCSSGSKRLFRFRWYNVLLVNERRKKRWMNLLQGSFGMKLEKHFFATARRWYKYQS